MRKKFKAFTIIEVLAVITLISILAAIAFPGYAKVMKKRNEHTAIANLMAMRSAARLYVINSNGNAIPDLDNIGEVNTALGLALSDPISGAGNSYLCRAVGAHGTNACRVNLPDGSRLHFHLDGAHNTDGSIHCRIPPCPSCPADPGSCG